APVPHREPVAFEGSAIARAPDDSALYIADEDHRALRIVPLPLVEGAPPETLELPGRPAQVVATDGQLLITLRELADASGALLVLDRATKKEVARVALPQDAWGLALAPDESYALVTSAWAAKLSAVDLAKHEVRYSLPTAREPRGITFLPDGSRAYVSHLVGAAVTKVETPSAAEPQLIRVDLPSAPARSPIGAKLQASLGYAAVASPSGERVFFPRHAIGALGSQAWFGTGAVDVLATSRDEGIAPARSPGMPVARHPILSENAMSWLQGVRPFSDTGFAAFVQPRAAVYRRRTDTLLVAGEGDDSLVELDATMLDPTFGVVRRYTTAQNADRIYHVANRGGAPSGIALSAAEDLAYVYCRSTDELMVLRLPTVEGAFEQPPPLVVRLAEPHEDESYRLGRRLFFNATDPVMSGGLACAGCHPEGRDDGYVWHEVDLDDRMALPAEQRTEPEPSTAGQPPRFFGHPAQAETLLPFGETLAPEDRERTKGYPMQTPMLAGRVGAQASYGWHAESSDIFERIMASFELHRWSFSGSAENERRARAGHLAKFLREGLVPPARPERTLTAEEKRGEAIFNDQVTGCASCHVPATEYTDRVAVPLARRPPPPGYRSDPRAEYKTPSLRYVAGTAPYFHDGRYATLEQLVAESGNAMGKMAHLSDEDRRALLAFLRTL
ncbi:MAG: c-type cytochrome, partial [Myxococcales bacterium]|nr:c-type cytochrome [Myxococcales bacterium]